MSFLSIPHPLRSELRKPYCHQSSFFIAELPRRQGEVAQLLKFLSLCNHGELGILAHITINNDDDS